MATNSPASSLQACWGRLNSAFQTIEELFETVRTNCTIYAIPLCRGGANIVSHGNAGFFDLNGKLRLTRTGSVVTGYYWYGEGNAWMALGSNPTDFSTAPLNF